jgi:hypothetical protein
MWGLFLVAGGDAISSALSAVLETPLKKMPGQLLLQVEWEIIITAVCMLGCAGWSCSCVFGF